VPSSALTAPVPISRYFIYLAIALGGCAADLATKETMFRWLGLPAPFVDSTNPANMERWSGDPSHNHVWWLWSGHVGIETSINTGALFGLGAGYWWLFAGLSVLALLGILTWLFIYRAAADRWLTVALGCVTAGILGNLYDRLGLWDTAGLLKQFHHGVRDWILVRYSPEWTWPNFNIADSLLVTGAIMLVVHAFVWREAKQAL
jgi:signal peptidase II